MVQINGTLMQYFHWYIPSDGSLWCQLQRDAAKLSSHGITALWLPPAYKGNAGGYDVGYGVYDMYDLGEFDQKGSIRTKYGTKDEYLEAIATAHKHNIQIYADIVFNHRGGADETEWVKAVRVYDDNRNFSYGEEIWIEAFTRFTFAGRNKKYSDFTWNYKHFTGVDWANNLHEKAIYKFLGLGKNWQQLVSGERGNYDYLMYSDIDTDNPEVRTELARWGKWYIEFANIDGFRIDAVKHIQYSFFRDWLDYLRRATGKELFAVGEYWNPYNVEPLLNYINHTGGRLSLFDAPLQNNFHKASRTQGYDMRTIFDNSLLQIKPTLAVTLVDNHDTQPCQALEATVDWWFKPLAYALILLRAEGYPCIFYPDYYGANYHDKGYDIYLAPVKHLPQLMMARNKFAYGTQHNYLDHWATIGWTREGDEQHPNSGIAVVMSNGDNGYKDMYIGTQHAGRLFVDYLKNTDLTIVIKADGTARFTTPAKSLSVWVPA